MIGTTGFRSDFFVGYRNHSFVDYGTGFYMFITDAIENIVCKI